MQSIFSKINWPISISSSFLLSIGILVIYSSSKELSFQQLLFAVLGFAIFLIVSQFDYRSIKGFIIPFYLLTIILLIVVQLLGVETRGAIRWIPVGIFNIQPSEFSKPVLILVLSQFWLRHKPNWINILKSLLWVLPLIFLIFKQPDLGSSLTLVAIWIGILLANKVSPKKIVILAILVVFIVPIGWFSLHDYQKQRIITFLTPNSDPLGRGYNLIQSTIAVGSGQFFGRGLGRGTQSRLQFLPEFRTDFIFASIAEEMGFVGSLLILSIYFFLLSYCLKVSEKAYDFFGFLIVFGVVSMLFFQTIVNIGMNLGLLPITGITLPLISYGGSSVIATLFSLGLAASVSKFKKKIDTERY